MRDGACRREPCHRFNDHITGGMVGGAPVIELKDGRDALDGLVTEDLKWACTWSAGRWVDSGEGNSVQVYHVS